MYFTQIQKERNTAKLIFFHDSYAILEMQIPLLIWKEWILFCFFVDCPNIYCPLFNPGRGYSEIQAECKNWYSIHYSVVYVVRVWYSECHSVIQIIEKLYFL